MLLDELKKANIQAMKDKNTIARSVYSVVITRCQLALVELRAKNQDLTDNNVLEIIQKVMKELSDEKAGYEKVGNVEKANIITEQTQIIASYLPKQLTRDEIIAEINTLSDKSVPSVMKHFKANFAGKVDMSLVSQIARGL
ncbi:MAG: GatB/YqeY domain-containing protein [Bacilli bacterium]|nr:GatB/YqeY domain-containing protein [Bacilli bacterium]